MNSTPYPIADNWWPSYQEPHPVPHRHEKVRTEKERQHEEREFAKLYTKLTKELKKKLANLSHLRAHMDTTFGDVNQFSKANIKHKQCLNDIISIRDEMEQLKTQQESE
jgi:hypothetical protein